MDIADGETTFYICKDGYPFAFHLDARSLDDALDINLKPEGVAIDQTYPEFVKWATQGRPETMKWW